MTGEERDGERGIMVLLTAKVKGVEEEAGIAWRKELSTSFDCPEHTTDHSENFDAG